MNHPIKVVIQCANTKQEAAGTLRSAAGDRVNFVAHPAEAPPVPGVVYAHPDGADADGRTWRSKLEAYNQSPHTNPLGLLEARKLYRHPAYVALSQQLTKDDLHILSAGWGLLSADFLTPTYDITFSGQAESYKRRRPRDRFNDFCMLDNESDVPLAFFGGKDYFPLFKQLTEGYRGHRIVVYNSSDAPNAPGITAVRYETTTRTNWHYEAGKAWLDGRLTLPAA